MTMLSRTAWPITAVLLMLPTSTWAQDSHYWTNQYGTRANLLGGTVVGGTGDLASAFYNPAAISVEAEASLALSTDAVEFTRINVENGAGRGIDLKYTEGSTAPKIFALRFGNAHIVDGDRLAIAVLTRHDFKFDVDGSSIGTREVVPPPGPDGFAGEIRLEQKLYESWWGFSWAKAYEDRGFAVGVSTFLVYRSQNGRTQTVIQAVGPDSTGAGIVLWDEARYSQWRAIWKLGGVWGNETASWGAAVTTPSWDLGGAGRAKVNASFLNVPDSTGTPVSMLVADAQDNLRAYYKSPLSVAIGARARYGKTTFWGTAEWFDAVRRFNVLDPQDFQAQSNGETISYAFDGAARSVLNYGIGIDHRFDGSSVYAAFTTDFSHRTPEDDLSLTTWDIFHTTVGASLRARGSEFMGGLVYSFGKREAGALVDLSDPDDVLPDEDDRLEVSYRRFKLLFGFSVGF